MNVGQTLLVMLLTAPGVFLSGWSAGREQMRRERKRWERKR